MRSAAAEVISRGNVCINGRQYRLPVSPVVVICFDGCDPAYIDAAREHGVIPALESMVADGSGDIALAAMPTFTNPTNISIVCGAPPSVHGVSGNFYLDPASGETVMMLDASLMRAPTILSALSREGIRVAVVTAKDKLRKALAFGLDGIAFSAEKADACDRDEHGIDDVPELVGRPVPDQYSADLSLFVLDAGIRLLETRAAAVLYLSLSDFIQHKYGPTAPEALTFMRSVDERIGRLLNLGAVVGVTADHGMTDMCDVSGEPRIIYLGDILAEEFGAEVIRVICPIADPFVRHHGALGGFVRVHVLRDDVAPDAIAATIRSLPGVAACLTKAEAVKQLELPEDGEADIVVVGKPGVAIGATAAEHDLSQLVGERLRSHGSFSEQRVPFILSHPVQDATGPGAGPNAPPLRNYDIFDFVLNRVGRG